jgi:phosphatidylserine/phosphatidylglycerophosphate/cardiolipin synthase-like enzyme
MTRKTSSDTSPSKAGRRGVTRRSSTSQEQQAHFALCAAIVLIVLFLCLLAFLLLTGHGPLGLFKDATPTPRAASLTLFGSGSNWWQVYFTAPQTVNDPETLTGSVAEKLIDHINGAQRTVHIASFEFDLAPVAEALIKARERGVEVQWVTDDEYGIEVDEEEGTGLFPRLEEAGIEVRDDGRSALMHDKFWIFDGQTVWTGSTNITVNGIFRNNNNAIVMDSPRLAAIYEREFAEMWDGQFGPRSPSTADDQTVTIDGTQVKILFAPEDEALSHLIPVIGSAQDSIRFMAFSFTEDELGDAVSARAQAGVDVKGIFETRGSETEYSEMGALYCAGVPVRQDGNPGTFHHKVFVIDDNIVVTGSLNFSENADNSNDENVVIVTNQDIAALYLGEFQRRWTEATAPDPADVKCTADQ